MEDTINKYVSNIRALKYAKQISIDLKGEINKNTIMVGNFNTPLSRMDKYSTPKIKNETLDLNYTLARMSNRHIENITLNRTEYTFF